MLRYKKTARNGCNHYAPMSTLVKTDRHSIPDEWERGCTNAAILLVIMFLVLSLGSWWFGW